MRKLFILSLMIVAPLMACRAEPDSTPLQIIESIVQNAPADAYVVNDVENNDIVIKVPTTKELQDIYAMDKNAMFITGNFMPSIEEGFCFINNDIKYNSYRVFCGTANDISDKYWAVAIEKDN